MSAGCSRACGWTPQQPIKRAIQRDEAAIRRWRDEAWPELRRRARRERRALVFEDESGFYLLRGWSRPTPREGRPRSSARSRRATTSRSWGG